MPIKKTHTSARKKAPSSSSTSRRTKTSKAARKSKAAKKNEKMSRKELMELTLKMFRQTYDDYQQGKFHRIL
jgi:hypothetical protein